MSTITAHVASAQAAGRHALRLRRALTTATATTAIVAAVTVGGTAASASAQMLPMLDNHVTVALTSSAPTIAASVRAGLQSLPNSAAIHIDQVVKNVVQGD
jgi:hypothetical protein